jgi:N utilization substance protein B
MSSASRRRAREVALQVLYALDVNPELGATAAITQYFDRFADQDQDDGEVSRGPVEQVDRAYLEALVHGVSERRAELDERLGQVSRNWRVERIARVERNILRMALFELEHRDDVPARVTLNEAIELAKTYGAADAPAFVNGLLDSALHAPGSRK